MVMAIGIQVDESQQIDSPRGDIYHNLARAAICATPIMEHPDMDLMQNLVSSVAFDAQHTLLKRCNFQFYMIWYLLIFSDKDNAAIYAWSIMGLIAKLAQAVSQLHLYPALHCTYILKYDLAWPS